MWLAGNSGATSAYDKIGRITPAGTYKKFTNSLGSGDEPSDITNRPDGNLWFTDNGTDSIARSRRD